MGKITLPINTHHISNSKTLIFKNLTLHLCSLISRQSHSLIFTEKNVLPRRT